jgi:predicted nucleic acid-binding protein
MSSKFFFDTNILVYAISDQDPMRRERARVLLDEGGATSVQVLNELCSVMSRKFRRPHNEIEQVVDIFSEGLDIFPLTVQSQRLAMHIAARYRVGIYDANILATAEIAGLETVVSEDFSHRAQYGGVKVMNPFFGLASAP